jgi:hypothetical protein
MTVRKLLDDFQRFEGKILVYQGEVWNNLEFDADDEEEILSNAEVVDYELNYGTLYIEIK